MAPIVYVNPAFERVTGYSAAEAVGKNPRILKSGEQGPEVYRRMWEVIQRGEVYTGHFRNRRKDGTTYEADMVISPVRDDVWPDRQFRRAAAGRDPGTPLDDQLRQMQKMEAIGQLSGGIAHDLNNLLTVITANATLLAGQLVARRSGRPGIPRGPVPRRRTGRRHDPEAARLQPAGTAQAAALNPGHIPSETLRNLQRLVPASIDIRVVVPADLRPITADAGAVEQILMNLATNARDAMPDRRGPDHRGLRSRHHGRRAGFAAGGPARTGGRLRVHRVTDTGTGMDQALLLRMFEPFVTTKSQGKGTGLGMPMVYGLMTQHGGVVNVFSRPGEGTTVRLYFPAVRPRPSSRRRSRPPGDLRGGEREHPGGGGRGGAPAGRLPHPGPAGLPGDDCQRR